MKYYSVETSGFYDSDINTVIPSDAVEITNAEHIQYLQYLKDGYGIGLHDSALVLIYPAPSCCHTLKDDYYDYTGDDQWEVDETSYCDALKSKLKDELAEYRWNMTYGYVGTLAPMSYLNSFPIFHSLEARNRLMLTTDVINKKLTAGTLTTTDTYRFKTVDGQWTDVVVSSVIEWSEMLAETEQVFFETEETMNTAIDAMTASSNLCAYDVVSAFDAIAKPLLAADLAKYAYPIKYYTEDNA